MITRTKKNRLDAFKSQALAIITLSIVGAVSFAGVAAFANPKTAVALTNPLYYTFNTTGTLYQAATAAQSSSPYFWLENGAQLAINNGVGSTPKDSLQFVLLARAPIQNSSTEAYMNRVTDNLSVSTNRHPYNGESIIARFQDINNYYYAGLRADGAVVIKKKTAGVYKTLAMKKVLPGTYSATTNPDLIPLKTWIGLKLAVIDNAAGVPQLSLSTDIGKTGTWKLALSVQDDPALYGKAINTEGLEGVQSDYAAMQFDNFKLADLGAPTSAPVPTATSTTATTVTPIATTTTTTPATITVVPSSGSYDAAVLSASPALYLTMASASSGSESDKSGHGMVGTYKGGAPLAAVMPNGDKAADFNGTNQYLTVPSNAALSIPTAHKLTWEAWIRPDTLQFGAASSDGYIDWMGKCEQYGPTCEWEARMYNSSTAQGRPNRLSGYVFNPSAGLGSAADWQPAANLIQAGKWIHVVAEYDTTATPAGCSSAYPGSINIWVNGIKQSFADHAPTGCMSQYSITPRANNSALNIGTMALDTWFKGAVGKVAIYDRLLSPAEIASHFTAMTGQTPSGSCGATCTALMP